MSEGMRGLSGSERVGAGSKGTAHESERLVAGSKGSTRDSKNGLPDLGSPRPGVDERDIMFSRALLVPGTERYEAYYGARPENRAKDDLFRKEAGLLAPGSAHYHSLGFAAADAAFWTVERLRPFVEGDEEGDLPGKLGRAGQVVGGAPASRILRRGSRTSAAARKARGSEASPGPTPPP
jgi:hypothetical protein